MKPADPGLASSGVDGDDFEAAAATTKAHLNKALAVLAKFYGDLLNAGTMIPSDREVIDTYAVGSKALYEAVQHVELLIGYRNDEQEGNEFAPELELAWKELLDEGSEVPEKFVRVWITSHRDAVPEDGQDEDSSTRG